MLCRSLSSAMMSCGCACVSCSVVMSCCSMVLSSVSCLSLPCVGLCMYCLPRPACVFQVESFVCGGGGCACCGVSVLTSRIICMLCDG